MTAQADLFTGVTELPPSRVEASESYHELGVCDVNALGCAECVNSDWKAERCRLLRRTVNVDFGTCSEVKA
jgi:hypothetical protein